MVRVVRMNPCNWPPSNPWGYLSPREVYELARETRRGLFSDMDEYNRTPPIKSIAPHLTERQKAGIFDIWATL